MNDNGLKIVRTMCPMNCHPTLCGMLAEVRDGQLVGVQGDEANPGKLRYLLCKPRIGEVLHLAQRNRT